MTQAGGNILYDILSRLNIEVQRTVDIKYNNAIQLSRFKNNLPKAKYLQDIVPSKERAIFLAKYV